MTTVSLATVHAVIARAITSGIHDRGRIERAATLIAIGAVSQQDATTYTVKSQSNQAVTYTVTPNGCECIDAARHPSKRCKHDIAVRILLSAAREDAAQREQAARARFSADSVAVAYASARRAA